jgi:hypothetical protein
LEQLSRAAEAETHVAARQPLGSLVARALRRLRDGLQLGDFRS